MLTLIVALIEGLDETVWSPSRCLLEDVHPEWCVDFPDGRYPLTVFGGSCECFIQCSNNAVVDKRACWLSYVFNPLIEKCDYYANVSSDLYLFDSCPVLNVGHSPSCFNRTDGFFGDQLGRCNMYYQCTNRKFVKWYRCPSTLIFNPLTSRCDDGRNVPRDLHPRCGQGPSCRGLKDGLYPDQAGLCHRFFGCRSGMFQSFYMCKSRRLVFDPKTSRCQTRARISKDAYPPMMSYCTSGSPDCWSRSDGLYPDDDGRCNVFFECKASRFRGWRLCPGGLAFNPTSQRCEDEFSIPRGSYAKAFVKAYSSSSSFAKAYSVGDPAESAVGDPERIRPKWSGSGIPTNPRRRSKIEDRRGNNFERGEEPNEIDRSTPKALDVEWASAATKCETAPSCSGKRDGSYPHFPRKCEWYYTCRNSSFVGFSRCGGFMRQPVFNEQTQRCDNPNDVPLPCGSFNEDRACASRITGIYPARQRGCSAYFVCENGKFKGYESCLRNQVFNRHLLRCADRSLTPPPCGLQTVAYSRRTN